MIVRGLLVLLIRDLLPTCCTPNNGGPMVTTGVTAGGLIFIAAATDDLLRAIDVDAGEVLWSDVLPAGGQATPISSASGISAARCRCCTEPLRSAGNGPLS
jgi:glucose dehydrogenase